jgi:hypothetical protein
MAIGSKDTRIEALQLALMLQPGPAHAEELVKAAKTIEAYLTRQDDSDAN